MTKIDGVILTPLKIIKNVKGDVYHSLKITDPGYQGFGEVYFSTINENEIKAWKRHNRMTLNLTVPCGEVKFVLFDDRETSTTKGVLNEYVLSLNNYHRLTVPPQVWMGFKGLSQGLNLIQNIANIIHDPNEQLNVDLNESHIFYDWSK